jgi:putative transposase
MRLLDASLLAAISHCAEVFGQYFKGWCATNNVSRSTAYRHKKRIEELGQWQPLSGSHAAASLAQKLSGRRT